MSDAEDRLKRALEEFGDMVPEDVVRSAHAFMSDHAAALSHARTEALEEAEEVFVEWGIEPAGLGKRSFQERIHALITTPAPATIPVRTIRGVLGNALSLDDDGRPDFDEGWACAVMHVASKLDALGMPGGAAIAPSKDTIPVEKVREALARRISYAASEGHGWVKKELHAVAEALGVTCGCSRPLGHTDEPDCFGVPLDTTQKALACVKCKRPVESEDVALMPETSTCRRCHNKAPPEDEP